MASSLQSKPEKTAVRVTKAAGIADDIRSKIQNGELVLGHQLPPVSQMRAAFNAAPMTVEKAYSLLEREGWIVRENGRGVFVSSTRKRSTGLLGYAGSIHALQMSNDYYARINHGFRRVAQAKKLSVLLCDVNASERENEVWKKTDGVVFLEEGQIKKLSPDDLNIPCVMAMVGSAVMDSVCANDADGIRQAVRHLFSLGHQRIGYVITDFRSDAMKVRLSSYHAAMKEAGLTVKKAWVRMPNEQNSLCPANENAAQQIASWLQKDWDKTSCTALLAQNDEAAVGVIAAFDKAGLKVPIDVSVIGFDDLKTARLASPALTTIAVPLEKIGEECARLLIDPTTEVRHRVLDVHLVVRHSTEQAIH